MTSQGAEGLSLCPGLSASPSLLSRLGQTLSVRGEDIGEDTFSKAMGQAVRQWPGAKLLDHGCVESSILGKLSHQFLPPVLGLAVPQLIPILLGDLKEEGKTDSVSFAAPNKSPSLCLTLIPAAVVSPHFLSCFLFRTKFWFYLPPSLPKNPTFP